MPTAAPCRRARGRCAIGAHGAHVHRRARARGRANRRAAVHARVPALGRERSSVRARVTSALGHRCSARFARLCSMSRALVIALLFVLFAGSTAALWLGVRGGAPGAQRPSQRLRRRGAAAVDARLGRASFGCVRHDLAVAVTADGARLSRSAARAPGARSDEDRRCFTPLSARDDCDEGRAPQRIFALVEDDDALGNTIGRVYKTRVAPPPVPAFVEGVIGYGAARRRWRARGRAKLQLDLGRAPLLAKGRHPGVLWVARGDRRRRCCTATRSSSWSLSGRGAAPVAREARGHFSDDENDFYQIRRRRGSRSRGRCCRASRGRRATRRRSSRR